MEIRYLDIEEINDETIAGYGCWIRQEMQKPYCSFPEFTFWNGLAVTNHVASSFGIVTSHASEKMVSTTFEQHLKTTETLLPIEKEIVLVLAKPDMNDIRQIDFLSVRAFRLKAGEAIVLNPGTWHFAPHVKEGSVKTWVVFEKDTPDKDIFLRYVDKENSIQYIVRDN